MDSSGDDATTRAYVVRRAPRTTEFGVFMKSTLIQQHTATLGGIVLFFFIVSQVGQDNSSNTTNPGSDNMPRAGKKNRRPAAADPLLTKQISEKKSWTNEDALASVSNHPQYDLLKEFLEEDDMRDQKTRKEVYESKTKKVPQYLVINDKKIKVEFQTHFPAHVMNKKCIYVCDHCLCVFDVKADFDIHKIKKDESHFVMPGRMIYDDAEEHLKIYEVCAGRHPSLCRTIGMLGQCFIETKSAVLDNDVFNYYVLMDYSDGMERFVGYFSRQKYGFPECNLACLFVLPTYQGKGFGWFLVDFSYRISQALGVPGGPEMPLSEQADRVYFKYIRLRVLDAITDMISPMAGKTAVLLDIPMQDLAKSTGINAHHIVSVFQRNGFLSSNSNDSKFEDLSLTSSYLIEQMDILSKCRNVKLSSMHFSNSTMVTQEESLYYKHYGEATEEEPTEAADETAYNEWYPIVFPPPVEATGKRRRKKRSNSPVLDVTASSMNTSLNSTPSPKKNSESLIFRGTTKYCENALLLATAKKCPEELRLSIDDLRTMAFNTNSYR